jgi:hypothetical protein
LKFLAFGEGTRRRSREVRGSRSRAQCGVRGSTWGEAPDGFL